MQIELRIVSDIIYETKNNMSEGGVLVHSKYCFDIYTGMKEIFFYV